MYCLAWAATAQVFTCIWTPQPVGLSEPRTSGCATASGDTIIFAGGHNNQRKYVGTIDVFKHGAKAGTAERTRTLQLPVGRELLGSRASRLDASDPRRRLGLAPDEPAELTDVSQHLLEPDVLEQDDPHADRREPAAKVALLDARHDDHEVGLERHDGLEARAEEAPHTGQGRRCVPPPSPNPGQPWPTKALLPCDRSNTCTSGQVR